MSIPNRTSDAGPDSRPDCPTCGSRKWHTLAPCEDCGGTVCDRCPYIIEATLGMYCACCVRISELLDKRENNLNGPRNEKVADG